MKQKTAVQPQVDFYRYMERVVPHALCVRCKLYAIGSGEEQWRELAIGCSVI